jgi:hypothetical protein
LLEGCYTWILDDSDFERWKDSEKSRLLWIKGDPGKGKTMMMIALAKDLSRQLKARASGSRSNAFERARRLWAPKPKPCLVSYFFCQSTDSRLNSAHSVLRGLIYLLVSQEKGMVRHLKKRYDDNGSGIFEGSNAVYTLRSILKDILNDIALPRTYLLIDALDECTEGLQQLLDIITDESFAMRTNVKWLVASRNQSDIAERIRPDNTRANISLELNSKHVAKAVNTFIDSKVHELARRKQYAPMLEGKIRTTLSQRSEATFLWVALACKRLEHVPVYEVESVLEELPAGLDELYQRMIKRVLDGPGERVEHCKQILRSAAVAYRPLRLQELAGTTQLPDKILDNVQYLNDLVERCGYFLTLRNETIFFIHQSAKDYIVRIDGREDLGFDQVEEHRKIAISSLSLLSKTLKENFYSLAKLGTLIGEVREAAVTDTLLRIEYAACYWVNHLSGCLADSTHAQLNTTILSDGGIVHEFLQAHLIHWLEALSWMGKTSEGIMAISSLETQILVSLLYYILGEF